MREDRKLQVTVELEERYRSVDLSVNSQDWGWHSSNEPLQHSRPSRIANSFGKVAAALSISSMCRLGGLVRHFAYRHYDGAAWSPEQLLTKGSHDESHPVVAKVRTRQCLGGVSDRRTLEEGASFQSPPV